jgi:hypothetical protein
MPAELRARYEAELSALRGRLAWYAENQSSDAASATASTAAIVSQQAATIAMLQAKIAALAIAGSASASATATAEAAVSATANASSSSSSASAQLPATHRRPSSSFPAAAQRRIRELEHSLKVAEEALAKRHPDSLANLIREVKADTIPAINATDVARTAEIESLRKQLQDAQLAAERRVNLLRQDHEKLKAGWQKRETQLKTDLELAQVGARCLDLRPCKTSITAPPCRHDCVLLRRTGGLPRR